MRSLPERVLLKEMLSYDPETGSLTWNTCGAHLFPNDGAWKAWNTRFAGKPAFTASDSKGAKVGSLKHVLYKAHRVIYKMMTGEDPRVINHINGDPSDNRWSNLRSIPGTENQKNMKRSRSNSSGTTGVSWDKSKNSWAAVITVDRKPIHLGRFKDINDAIAARKQAEATYGFHINHGRS